MKNEDKIKLAKKRKEQHGQELQKQHDKSEQEAKEKQQLIDSIKESIDNLGEQLKVDVSVDLNPLLEKLDVLKELPESFGQVKDLAQKTHDLLSEDKEVSIKGFRDLWELTTRSNNATAKEQKEGLKYLGDKIEKFADLQVYLDQLNETLKQGQDPTDFKPVRLVVGGDGVPLRFLHDMPSRTGGGGTSGGGTTNGLTDDQLRASPVEVSVSGGVTLDAGDIEIGAVELKNGSDDTRATVTAANALKVDGSAVTQPISGTVSVTEPVSVDDNGGSLTVDGTVAATQSGTWTEANSGAIKTSVELIDDTVVTDGSAASTKGIQVAGQDGTNAQTIRTDTTGNQGVYPKSASVAISDSYGNSPIIPLDEAGTGAIHRVVYNLLYNGSTWSRLRESINATNSTGTGILAAGLHGQFDDTSPGAITENRFGPVRMSSRREMYNQIRDAAGNERGANVTASNELNVLDSNSAAIKTAVETIDNAISGSEMQVDVVASLPAGTNNIGDVDVLSSALPTGASTLAEQQTQTTSLQLIDDVVGTVDAATPTKALLTGGSDGTNILADRAAKISTLNSTSTPLGSNATWTGSWEDSLGYSALIITGLVDQASATNGAVIQYATDSGGTNIVDTDENTIQLTGEAVTFILPFSARYFRISYTNGAIAQSAFTVTTRLTPQTASSPILPLGATIKLTDGGGLTRSVLAIQNNAGTGVANLSATASGNLPVSISEAVAEIPIKALTGLNVGQQSITTTASQVTSAATNRNTICIKALIANTAAVYLGTTSGVTTSNGFELNPGEPIEFDLVEGQAIYAIAASGTQAICKAEVS